MGASIGQNIKNLRLSHDLTQEQLGKILGVNKSAVQKYEAGDVKNLKRETIKRLCNHFRAYPYEFIFESGEYWMDQECLAFMKAQNIDNIEFNAAEAQELIEFFTRKFSLTDEGFQKVIAYMDDLTQIEKYKRRL
ncbi:MAG: helix-turn-helix transcriptional regulator [Peptococcaceae bacterium]|nr:helix-turn-helix transcriptional regulator [Peptococcaceae bacterium]